VWEESVLYSFCNKTNCGDGMAPLAGLLMSKSGTLYGTASKGGNGSGGGTLFALTNSGGQWSEAEVHQFGDGPDNDGKAPYGSLSADKNGVLYGTTVTGGNAGNDCGTVYAATGGAYQQLYAFCPQGSHSNGVYPYGGVAVATDTSGAAIALYGTTLMGGNPNAPGGTLFKLDLKSGGLTVLYDFCSLANCTDGVLPEYGAPLLKKGALYGTTFRGGTNNIGIVYTAKP
jgi:uncharacterized repeat protein (TIGR03803 family)